MLNHAHSLTVARMVSLPRFGSLWAFGPSAHRARASLRACRGLGQSPKALCRSIFRERCERPKARRKACALWALATGGGKATRSAPEGSVSPVGCCAQRKATRRCEQIQGLRATSAQNADICERQGSAND